MENQSSSHQGEPGSRAQIENPSSEKKDKYLMIAKKAKEARDDALRKNASLQEENVNLHGKVSNLEKQLKTSQEMLVVLTDQKLNLAMELDDLKKSRIQTNEEIKKLASKCLKLETQAESYKRQYDKVLTENDTLLQKLETIEQKLLAETKRAKQTQADIKKLHENNENVKSLWSNVSKEKQVLEEQLNEASNKLTQLQKDHKKWYSYLSGKYNLKNDKIESWINGLEGHIRNMSSNKNGEEANSSEVLNFDDELKNFSNENSQLKAEIQNLKESLSTILLDKENAETEFAELHKQNEQLNFRLENVNQDRDKMVKNFEEVRVETRQLIENTEKLSQDLESLKSEKNQIELELSATNYERNLMEQDLIEKKNQIECLLVTLKNNQTENDELQSELNIYKEEITKLNILLKNNDTKLEHDLKEINEKYLDSIKELNDLQIQNQNLTQEVEADKSKMSELMKQIAEEQDKCLIFMKENDVLKENLLKLQNTVEQVGMDIESSKLDENKLRSDFETLKKEHEELLKTNTHVSKEFDELSSMKKALIEEKEKIWFEKCELEKESKNIQEKLTQCEQSLLDKNMQNKLLCEEVKILKESINSDVLKIQEEKLLNVEKEREELQCKITTLETNISNYQIKGDNYQLEIDNLRKTLSDLECDRNRLLSEIKPLKERNTSLTTDLEKATQILVEKSKEMENISFKNSELQNNLKKLESDLEVSRNDTKVASENLNTCNESKLVALGELEKYKNTILFKEKQLKSTEIELREFEQQLNSLKEQEKIKNQEIVNLKQQCEKYEKDLAENGELIQTLNTRISQSGEEIEQKIGTMDLLEKKLEELDHNKISLTQKVESLTAENMNLNKVLENTSHLKNQRDESLSKLTEELKNSQDEVKIRLQELEENNRIWIARLTVLKGGLVGLKHTNEDMKKYFQEIQSHCTSHYPLVMEKIQDVINKFVEHTVVSSKHELLAEMQHMNQALKERGEVISKLQETISENKCNIKKLDDDNQELKRELQQIKQNCIEKDEQLKNKDILIKELEHEINRIKENQENSADGDMMSSSTISRTEEQCRLKDIEESFEERYVKLKYFTAKLKKRLSDVTHNLEAEKIKMASERSEYQEKIHSLSAVAKNAQTVQASCDKLLDEVEEEKKKTRSLQLSLENSQKNEEAERAKVVTLESEAKKIPALRKQTESLESSLKDAKKEIQNLQKEKKVEMLKYEDLKKESIILEKKLAELSLSLEQAKLQGKATNVLELEIQNYEKTIADFSSQLNSEKDHTKHLNGELEAMKSLNNGLEEQIKLLEGRINVDEERNLYVSEQLKAANQKIGELQSQTEQHLSTIHSLQKDLQSEKSRCETLLIESSAIGSEFKKREVELLSQVDNLQRHVNSLESILTSTTQDLESSRNEVEHLQSDFDSYRIRAQSVLAKQKGDITTQGEKEAREQMELLNNEVQILRQKLDSAISDLDAIKTESALYLSEKEKSDKRLEELSKVVQSKTRDNDQLNAEFRTYKISAETLVQSYKAKIEDKDIVHKKELEEQQRKIEELKNRINERELFTNENDGSLDIGEGSFSPLSPQHDTESLPPEREDGEGSESVPSPKTRRKSMLIPLDVLLNSPLDEESRVAALSDQVQKLRNEITGYEVRTRHLSSLLSEAEKDSARNAQLNSVLKEEVRRLERSLEREPHAKNTEYLKNVIIKFLTLQSGDERTRLIPVLDTILKLSPEETHKLSDIAKGDKISSWGHYLPSWTGL